MDDLVGGSLTLEQRYDLETYVGTFGGVAVYEGLQQPLQREIWIHVLAHPGRRDPTVARDWVDRVRSAVNSASTHKQPELYEVIDFGEVDDGVPFIVYARDDATRLSELVGSLTEPQVEQLTFSLSNVLSDLADRGSCHGALSPEFVFVQDGQVRLTQTGIGFTRSELDGFSGNDLHGLFSFPPPIVLDSASHEVASDAYGLAALAYFVASGVHPHLDAAGKLVASSPESLATYGFTESFSIRIHAQFSEETRDLEGLRDGLQTVELDREPVHDGGLFEEPTPRADEPSNVISILAVIIVVLLVCNALTFLWASRSSPEIEKPTTRVEMQIIPRGFLLKSEPVGADVTDIVTGKELGRTPITVNPRISNGNLKLKLTHRGFQSSEIAIVSEEGNDDVVFVRLRKNE